MKSLTMTAAAAAIFFNVGSAWADGLVARTNTNQVAEGDSFQLSLMVDGAGNGVRPDLSPLSQDFDVLGMSQSSQTQIINGNRSQTTSWIVTLSPHTKGAVTIPSLSAGTFTSDPVTINVVDASQLPKLQGTTGISLSASIDAGDHYRFQEIPLTVRIETAQQLQSAELIPPTGDFELTHTGQDRQSQINRDGQPVSVVERSYVLRPQSVGALTIPPFTLKGAVNDPNARNDPFSGGFAGGRDPFAMMNQMMTRMGGMGGAGSPFQGMFRSRKPFEARSDALIVDVLANPNGGSGSDWFLPAKAVELRGAWQSETPVFREGEAVTRTISILALGARPEQLPDLRFDNPLGARIYLDDTKTGMAETADGTVAQRDFVVSIVPTYGGDITLPEIAVEWLDTASGETKLAKLPAQIIHVEGNPAPVAATPQGLAAQNTALPAEMLGTTQYWWAAGFTGSVGLVAGFVLWRRRTMLDKAFGARCVEQAPVDPMRLLQDAAKSGDADRFYSALLSLKANPGRITPASIAAVITKLEHAAYAQTNGKALVDLKSLLAELKQGARRRLREDALHKALPPLYPQT